jgi:PKHD-type hydroxylase
MKLLGRQSLLRTVLLAAVLCADPSTSRRARKGHASARTSARESPVLLPQLRSFPGVLSEEQCEQLIAAADGDGKQFAGATTFGLDSSRDSDIRWLPREHASVAAVHRSFAAYTRSANEDGWGWPLTRPETQGLQFAKYEEPHGGYDWHVDAVPQRDRKGGKQMVTRMVTLVAQLSDPDSYTGGDLQVGAVNASRERGTLHVFPSSMAHKVWPTTAGTRWSVVSWNGGVLEDAPHYFAAAIDSYTHMLSAATQDSKGLIDAASPLPTVDTISSWKKLLARTYTFVGKLDDAEAVYEEATLLTPEDMSAFNNLGTCRVKQVTRNIQLTSAGAFCCIHILCIFTKRPDSLYASRSLDVAWPELGKIHRGDRSV